MVFIWGKNFSSHQPCFFPQLTKKPYLNRWFEAMCQNTYREDRRRTDRYYLQVCLKTTNMNTQYFPQEIKFIALSLW